MEIFKVLGDAIGMAFIGVVIIFTLFFLGGEAFVHGLAAVLGFLNDL